MVDRIKRRSFLTSLAALGVVPSLGACAEVVPTMEPLGSLGQSKRAGQDMHAGIGSWSECYPARPQPPRRHACGGKPAHRGLSPGGVSDSEDAQVLRL